MTTHHYSLYGLRVDSFLPCPGLAPGDGAAEVEIRRGEVPDEIPDVKKRGVLYQAAPGRFRLAVDNVARKYTKDPPGIKWPNDILCRGRKLCGILLESRIGGSGTGLADGEAGNPAFAILGVGFNVSQREDDFPAELRATSTSLAMESNDGKLPSPARLLAELVTAIRAACARAADDFPGVLQEIRQASTLLGRNVRFEATGRPVRGRAYLARRTWG